MFDEELEKTMLYYLIFEQEEYILDENDFVNDRNKKIIKAINELKAEHKEVSILAIKSKIKANSAQVLEYITALGEYIKTTNAQSTYDQLMELSKKRKLIKLFQEVNSEILNCDDIDILAQEFIKKINSIEQINDKEKTFFEQVIDATEQIEKNTIEKTDYSLYTRFNRFR